MKVSRGALVAGGVGVAAAGTIVVRNRSRRRKDAAMSAAGEAQTIVQQPGTTGDPQMTVIAEEPPGDLAKAS